MELLELKIVYKRSLLDQQHALRSFLSSFGDHRAIFLSFLRSIYAYVKSNTHMLESVENCFTVIPCRPKVPSHYYFFIQWPTTCAADKKQL